MTHNLIQTRAAQYYIPIHRSRYVLLYSDTKLHHFNQNELRKKALVEFPKVEADVKNILEVITI